MRKWLSLLKPINKIFFNVTPNTIVNELVAGLNESWLAVGNLSFSDTKNIEAYSLVDKSPYQILKDVIAPFTDSVLYFTTAVVNGSFKLLINYKSNAEINNNISPIELNTFNPEFLSTYGIIDIAYENTTEQYANVVRYVSDNTISNDPNVETLKVNADLIFTKKGIEKVDLSLSKLLDEHGKEINFIILETKVAGNDKFAHFIYSQGSTQITVHPTIINKNYTLHLQYYNKERLAVELSREDEITAIASVSGTNGRIFILEKMNDVSNSRDLVRKAQNKLDLSAVPHKTLEVTSRAKIWGLMDVVKVTTEVDAVNDLYMVAEINGTTQVAGLNNSLDEYIYKLNKSKNTDTWINTFDSQSYRDNSVVEGSTVTFPTETVDIKVILNTTAIIGSVETIPVNEAKNIEQVIESSLVADGITYKYKDLVVNDD